MQNIEAVTGDRLRDMEAMLNTFQNISPALSPLLRVTMLNDYNDFVALIHDVIDQSVRYMMRNPQHHQNKREESLTDTLLQHFDALNIEARPETSVGGHCDIVIEHRAKGWLWLGEAKKHSNYEHLNGGMNQLLDRYAMADEGQDQGGLVIFIFNRKAAKVIQKWRKLVVNRDDCADTTDSPTRQKLSFFSHHPETDQTGLDFHVKHIGVPLYHAPDDKKPLPTPS